MELFDLVFFSASSAAVLLSVRYFLLTIISDV